MMDETPSALHTRPSLLVRIRDPQDAEAWTAFMALYAPVVYRSCRGKGLQDADAADVTQDVMAEVMRSMRTFEYQPERGRFRDWLRTVTGRVLARFFKAQAGAVAAVPADQLDEVAAAPAEAAWTDELNAAVYRAAVANVRPHFEAHTWRAFEMVWLERRPAAEVARELNLSIAAVYVAKSRVLKALDQASRELIDDVPW